MNKFVSLAVIALLSSATAIKLSDDDLWSDDAQAEETLASIQSAEKSHNKKFAGISIEDQQELIKQKSQLNFSDDEFVNYSQKKFNQNLVALENDVHYPMARPIGEMLMMLEDGDSILAGSSVNDEDDVNDTV